MASLTKINNDSRYKIIKNIQQQIEEKFYPQLLSLTNAGEKWLKTIEDMTSASKTYITALNEFSKSSPENCEGAEVASHETKEMARNFDLVLKEYTESIESIRKFVAKLQVQSKKEKSHIATMKETFDQQVKKKNALMKKKKLTDNDVQEFLNVSLEEHENIAKIRYDFIARFNREITKKQIEFCKNALQLIDPSYSNTRHNTLSKDDAKNLTKEDDLKNVKKEDENLEQELIEAAEEIKNIVQEEPINNIINIQEIHTTDTESLPSRLTSATVELVHEELPESPFVIETPTPDHTIIPIEDGNKGITKDDNENNNNIMKQKQMIEEFEKKVEEVRQNNTPPVVMPRVTKIKNETKKVVHEQHHRHQYHHTTTSPITIKDESSVVKHYSSSFPDNQIYHDRIPIPAPDYDDKPIPIFKYNTWEYGNLVLAKIYYSPRSKAELGLEKGKKYFFMKGGNRGWIFCRDLDTSRSGWCPSDFVELYKS
uniref:SH3 domain-containing protein n=1 Tax=Strongyloides venezuelensis TaxID=75913 RepID=A0A0K0EY25_STRVS